MASSNALDGYQQTYSGSNIIHLHSTHALHHITSHSYGIMCTHEKNSNKYMGYT